MIVASKRYLAYIGVGVVVVCVCAYFVFVRTPASFPQGLLYEVPRGTPLSAVASGLSARHIIRSEFAFKVLVTFFGMGRGAVAGDYEFESRENGVSVAYRIARGEYGLSRIRLTVPEGLRSDQIANLFDDRFYRFDQMMFRKLGNMYEGYLFPDTYYFLPNVTAEEVVDAMTANYRSQVEEYKDEIRRSGRSIRDIIIMASILEEEANTEESRRIVAGILWKRIAQRMPLQVDATFAFVNGKTRSSDLTLDDLQIDSPYNTYVYRGLPPGPISNPGIAAILDTIRPVDTPYYFYLSEDDGTMHYARTHDEHVANKFKYLK